MVSGEYSTSVSIIMPVYNAEHTVGRMVDSIIAQTFQDWELIAVDDGSTDRSGSILDSYAAEDARIRVVHKANGGVAAARQDGIDLATGIYTIHADSDDWVEPRMLEDMLSVAKDEKADIVIADFFADQKGGQSSLSAQRPKSLDAIEVLYGIYANGLFGGLWHKLIKKSAYDKASAHFYAGINYCEDLHVLTQILTRSRPKIAYLPKAYYHYVVNPSSLTQSVSAKGFESMKRFHAEALKLLPSDSRFSGIEDSFSINEFTVLFMNRLYHDKKELRKEYAKIKGTIGNRYGLRWKAGFWCIENGLIGLAHRLIKF